MVHGEAAERGGDAAGFRACLDYVKHDLSPAGIEPTFKV